LRWLFSSIGSSITQTVATKKDHELITHGPYGWVRHPLYSVGTLMFMALALVAANWFIAPIHRNFLLV
jgi:protein-S-isoprenylcysteine O-methyltransferase Ste14